MGPDGAGGPSGREDGPTPMSSVRGPHERAGMQFGGAASSLSSGSDFGENSEDMNWNEADGLESSCHVAVSSTAVLESSPAGEAQELSVEAPVEEDIAAARNEKFSALDAELAVEVDGGCSGSAFPHAQVLPRTTPGLPRIRPGTTTAVQKVSPKK